MQFKFMKSQNATLTVEMETLCTKFHAEILVTSHHIIIQLHTKAHWDEIEISVSCQFFDPKHSPEDSMLIWPIVPEIPTKKNLVHRVSICTVGSCFFLFSGGPGSRKGRIVDDLTNAYGCKFVCSEQLIMTELPRKLSTVMKLETIKDIKDLLEVWLLITHYSLHITQLILILYDHFIQVAYCRNTLWSVYGTGEIRIQFGTNCTIQEWKLNGFSKFL